MKVKKNGILIIPLLLGVYWLWFITSAGIQTSPDSGVFLECSLEMHSGEDYFLPPERPPLYPFLVHWLMYVSPFPTDAAALLSGLSMIIFLVFFSLSLELLQSPRILNLLLTAGIFFHADFQCIYRTAWTEGLFAAQMMGHFYFLVKHRYTGKPVQLILSAVMTGLAGLTRLLGIAMIISFLVYLIYMVIRESRKTWKMWLLYFSGAVIAGLPLAIFLARNYFTFGSLSGVRLEPLQTPFQQCMDTWSVLKNDISFWPGLLFFAALMIYLPARRGFFEVRRSVLFSMSYILLMAGIYMALLIGSTSLTRVDPVSTRYLAPLYGFLFLFTGGAAALPVARTPETGATFFRRYRRILIHCVFSLLAFMTVLHLYRGFVIIRNDIVRAQITGIRHPLKTGYNYSRNAKELAHFFANQLRATDRLVVVGVHETRGAIHLPHLARLTFFRSATLKSPEIQQPSIGNVLPHTGFSIFMKICNHPKQIVYRNLPKQRIGRKMFKKLFNIKSAEKTSAIYLVMLGNNPKLPAKDIRPLLPLHIVVEQEWIIGNFRLCRVIFT